MYIRAIGIRRRSRVRLRIVGALRIIRGMATIPLLVLIRSLRGSFRKRRIRGIIRSRRLKGSIGVIRIVPISIQCRTTSPVKLKGL
jgi:hypothetical protein